MAEQLNLFENVMLRCSLFYGGILCLLQNRTCHDSLLYTAMESFLLVSQIEPVILYLCRQRKSIRDENIAYFRHAWLSQTVA